MGKLDQRVAIVTGAGSGLGRGIALRFAQEGAKVAVCDIREEAAMETVELIRSQGGEAIPIKANVASAEEVKGMVDTTLQQYGRIDILLNNAGLPQAATNVEDVTEETWDRIMEVNAKGPFLGCKYVVPHMKKQGGGCIINTSSIASKRPRPGLNAYCASKGAVILLTKALAIELAPYNIRVNAINPGPADTDMLPAFYATMDPTQGRKMYLDSVPLGRLCRPEDIASMALYLASDEASYMTGSVVDVDGGRGI